MRQIMGKRGHAFVLVHGAWHGGWCWRDVAELLRQRGHFVSTPTQTGVGERAHLLSDSVDFETFVTDIANHLHYESLEGVVLVGHSFGASVVTAVADRMARRIDKLVFLDGYLTPNGGAPIEQLSRAAADERIRQANETSSGLTMPVPTSESLGIKDESQKTLLQRLLTPHPLKTYMARINLKHPLGNNLPCHYITCVDPPYAATRSSLSTARNAGWPVHALPFGHDVMIEAPLATANILEVIAGR